MSRAAIVGGAVTAAVLLIGAVITACGGGGEKTPLEEYLHSFVALNEVAAEKAARTDSFLQERLRVADTDTKRLQAYLAVFDFILEFNEEHLSSFQDLVPPPKAEAGHEAWVEANLANVTFLRNGQDELRALENWAEAANFISGLVSEPETIRLAQAINDACNTLQELADSEELDIDLLCLDALS